MKKEEIRIGNYVLLGEKITEVYSIDKEGINEYVDCDFESFSHDGYFSIEGRKLQLKEYVLIKIEPIPLTEDWLIKFGFEIQLVEIILDDFYLKRTEKHFEYYCNNRVELKYVHQLQNLYSLLTNKELSIKPLKNH